MTEIQRTIVIAYAALVAAWVIRHLVVIAIQRGLRRSFLTTQSPARRGLEPTVTAVIPAKDEESTLRDCLESVLAQSYPGLVNVVVVDDRSDDRTGAIARELAAEDPRLEVVTIEELPAGWTGKNHALHVGITQHARGEWLWLIDADTRHHRDGLAILLEHALDERADLASLLPLMRCESFWERVLQPLAGVVLMRSFPPSWVNRDGPKALPFANGQDLLVRRDVYDTIGGHAAVRDRFLEDIALARRVHERGGRVRLAISHEIGSTRMYSSLGQLIRGWSRIYYDGLGRSVWPLLGKIVEPLIFSQSAQIALLAALVMLGTGWPGGPFAWWILGLTVPHFLLMHTVLVRLYRVAAPTARSAIWYSLAGWIMDYIYLKAIAMCLTGRVTWRGTSYNSTSASPSDPRPQTESSPGPIAMGRRPVSQTTTTGASSTVGRPG